MIAISVSGESGCPGFFVGCTACTAETQRNKISSKGRKFIFILLFFYNGYGPGHTRAYPLYISMGLSPDGLGRGVGVGEAVDPRSGILEHGGPEVGQWSVFIWGEPVLTVGKSFKPASGEQAGYIGVAVSRT
jgi:hypothetical protein